MKISALFFFILLTSVFVLPSSLGARDLKEPDSVVQPEAITDPAVRSGRPHPGVIPCGKGSGYSYSSCNPYRARTRCSTYSRSCPP